MAIAIGLLKTLLELGRGSRTGVLDASGPGAHVRLFVEDGVIVNAEEGTVAETLGRILVRERVIDEEQYAAAIEWTADVRRQGKVAMLGEVFVELGMLTKEQLNAALSAQVRQKVVRALSWPSAATTFVEGHGELVIAERFPTPLEPLVLAALRTSEPESIDELLEQALERYPALQTDAGIANRVEALGLRPAEAAFVQKLDGTRTIAQLLATTAAVDPAVLIAALLLIECLDLHAVAQGEPAEPPSAVTAPVPSKRAKLRTRSSRPPPPLPPAPKPTRRPASVFPPPADAKHDVKKIASRLKAAQALKKTIPLPSGAPAEAKRHDAPKEDPGGHVARLLAEKSFQAGRKLLRANQMAKAADELARASALHPAPEYQLWAAWAALRTAPNEEPALVDELHAAAEKTLDLDPGIGFAWFVLSWLARRSGDVARANALHQRARTLDPRAVEDARDVRLRPADVGPLPTRGDVRPLAAPLGQGSASSRVVSPRALSEAPPPSQAPGPTSFEVAPTALAKPLPLPPPPKISPIATTQPMKATSPAKGTPVVRISPAKGTSAPRLSPAKGTPAVKPPEPRTATPLGTPVAKVALTRTAVMTQSTKPPPAPELPKPRSPTPAGTKVASSPSIVSALASTVVGKPLSKDAIPKVHDDDDGPALEPTELAPPAPAGSSPAPTTTGAATLAATPVPPRPSAPSLERTLLMAAAPPRPTASARPSQVDPLELPKAAATLSTNTDRFFPPATPFVPSMPSHDERPSETARRAPPNVELDPNGGTPSKRFEWTDPRPPMLPAKEPPAALTKTAPMAAKPDLRGQTRPLPASSPRPAPEERPHEPPRPVARAVAPPPTRKQGGGSGGFIAALFVAFVVAGVAAFLLFRSTEQATANDAGATLAAPPDVSAAPIASHAPSTAPPLATTSAPTATHSVATPVPVVAASASSVAVASASSVASVASAPSAKPEEDETARPIGAGFGMLDLPKSANGHRVWVDGKMVGSPPPAVIIPCGHHTVKVGSMGHDLEIDVPCAGHVTVPYP